MNLFSSSGLIGLPADLRDAVAAIRFAHPEALWLIFLLPLLASVSGYTRIMRKRAIAIIGTLSVANPSSHFRKVATRLAYSIGWIALCLGAGGPRWGTSDELGVAVGRDLIIVIDLSRSMLAEDMQSPTEPSRWQAARAGANDLLDAIARRGGDRVGLVIFASQAKLMCPLTTDYEHVRGIVADLDGRFPPPECRPRGNPNAISGTRIGAGLAAAVAAHDTRFAGRQDIILVSDGDDPARDREWQRGIESARKAEIPVHTVGVGDPVNPAFIPLENGLLESSSREGQPPELVTTQLREHVLKEIAIETRGLYVASRQESPRLGEFFQIQIERGKTRDLSEDNIPQLVERYVWFLGLALGSFVLGWGLRV